jgi:competence protein ComEA
MSSIASEPEVRDAPQPAPADAKPPIVHADIANKGVSVSDTELQADHPPRTLLRRADQAVIAVISLLALIAIGGYWVNQAVIRHRVIDLDKAPPLDPGYRVDINLADWPELAQLPEMGESLAQKIVAWRKEHGPFKELTDLRRVKGIGPKKFEAIRPFLRPIDKTQDAAERDVAEQERS